MQNESDSDGQMSDFEQFQKEVNKISDEEPKSGSIEDDEAKLPQPNKFSALFKSSHDQNSEQAVSFNLAIQSSLGMNAVQPQ